MNFQNTIVGFVLGAVSFVSGAAAQPSYECKGNLNAAEVTICRFQPLGDLDRKMSALFYDVRAALPANKISRFVSNQRQWRANRDTCKRDRTCLFRSYENRIDVLAAMKGRLAPRTNEIVIIKPDLVLRPDALKLGDLVAQPGGIVGGGVDAIDPVSTDVVERGMTADGKMVTVYADGRKVIKSPSRNICGTTTIYPDGSRQTTSCAQGQTPNIPDLPPNFQNWAAGVEDGLGTVLQRLITPEAYNHYLATEAGKDYYTRVAHRLDAIKFFSE